MPSRISQMRDGITITQQQSQMPNDATIEQIKQLMRNPSVIFNNLSPQLAQILQFARNGGNLQALAQQIAQSKNINLNELLNKLNS